MKTIFTFFACLLVSVAAMSQQRIMVVATSNNQQQIFYINELDEVTFYTLGEHESFHNGHVYVDLELPSKKLWATCNVGAEKPEDYGDYFAWAETEPKANYSWKSKGDYKYGVYNNKDYSTYGMTKYNNNDKKKQLDPEDDAATANWGGAWCMPTRQDWEELEKKCEWEWINEGGKIGVKLTSIINGAVLFLPAAGYRNESDLSFDGKYCEYWSSSLAPQYSDDARILQFIGSTHRMNTFGRCIGLPVRPTCVLPEESSVTDMSQQRIMTVTTSDHQQQIFVINEVDDVTFYEVGDHEGGHKGHEYVDLGLSVMWATCNVGAEKPEDYGDFFAWGETEPHNYETEPYAWATYKYGKDNDKLEKYCQYALYGKDGNTDDLKELVPSDDAATMNWGGSWRMPNIKDWEELENNCEWKWTNEGGKIGYKLTSLINGAELFLPAAGLRYNTSHSDIGSYGYYWSSSLYELYPYYACHLLFDRFSNHYTTKYDFRYYGSSVRPVYKLSEE